MASSSASGWRHTLLLGLFLSLLATCCYFIWARWVPWHVVATLPGTLASFDYPSRVGYVFDAEKATVTLADTGQSIELPAEYRGKIEIAHFPPSRASFEFFGSSKAHCWNVAAGCEVPVLAGEWRLSAGGTRILVMDVPDEKPRRFQILGLDGAVLRERILPASGRPVREHAFSAEGKFLIVTFPEYAEGDKTSIYEMASEKSWSFADHFGAVSEDGVVWLKDDPRLARALRAVRLSSGEELWRSEIPEGVSAMAYLGGDRLAVDFADSTTLFDAQSGRFLFKLESVQPLGYAFGLQIVNAGPKSYLTAGWNAWAFDTGRLLPFKGETPGIQFFDDGRRALIDVKCGWPGRVVEVETGRELFLFAAPPPAVVGPNVRLAGDRVIASERNGVVQVWERRHPEGWKGHFLRPEVLGAIFFGLAILGLWAGRLSVST